MIEGHDTRPSGLDHANFDTSPQSHFTQTSNQMCVTFDVGDATSFPRIEQLHRHDLHGEQTSVRQPSRLRLNLNRSLIVSDRGPF
jgi:hypothetical protein